MQSIAYSLGAAGSATEKLDQYASVAGQAATYDANGNRTSLAGLTTIHDSENRLVTASKTGMSVTYIYDAMGRRVMKDFSSGGADMVFASAGDMEIAEYSGAGQILRRYVPGLKTDDRVAMIECAGGGASGCQNGNVFWYHPDRLGNVIAVSNNTGQITDRYNYTPFGIEVPLNLTGNVFRYTGRRLDPETGLYHYRARYYDPSDIGGGRFLETDPVGYADQMNLYAYVGNDPLNATDPSGACPKCFISSGKVLVKSVIKGKSPDKAGIDEIVGIADDFGTIFSNPFSLDSAIAVLDLAVGTEFNNPKAKIASKAPPANNGLSRPHGNPDHDKAIDDRANQVRELGATDIRKNQTQVDIEGNRVGDNRPDLGYNLDRTRHNEEWGRSEARVEAQGDLARQNDPDCVTIGTCLPKK